MRLKQLETSGRVAVSLFAITILSALLAALSLMQHSTASKGLVDVQAVKDKYAGVLIISAMRGSMYKHVTEDESIAKVERWIAEDMSEEAYESEVKSVMEEDCVNCHSRTSEMTDAIPGMPLTSYEDVVTYTMRGLPTGKLLKALHTHLFAIGTVLLALSLLLASTDLHGVWKVLLTLTGFVGLWLDTGGWVLGRISESAAWLTIGGGALTSGSIAAMALLVLLDCWIKVPLLSRSESIESGNMEERYRQ